RRVLGVEFVRRGDWEVPACDPSDGEGAVRMEDNEAGPDLTDVDDCGASRDVLHAPRSPRPRRNTSPRSVSS
ncbi:MAG: hypothetical protein QGH45_25705, partial [Myxococcota bacterium]|nr:hypothetical protein [Myxococcota bacterium]